MPDTKPARTHAEYAAVHGCAGIVPTYGNGCYRCGWRTERELPAYWVWVGKGYGPDSALWSARDTRWPDTLPPVVDTHPAHVAKYARECALCLDCLDREECYVNGCCAASREVQS